MKKTSKLLAILLAGALLLTGCSTTSNSGDSSTSSNSTSGDSSEQSDENLYYNTDSLPICDEIIEVTMTGQQLASLDWQNTHQIQFIEEAMGIKIICEPIADDAWETQLTLMMASDTLPDLIVNSGDTILEANQYGLDGYLLDISQYSDIMPQFTSELASYPEYASSITTAEGAIYTVAKLNIPTVMEDMQRVFINQNWLDNLGLEAPSTIDELYTTLTAFKEEDANGNGDATDEIPMLFLPGSYDQAQSAIMSAFGIYSQERYYILQEDDDGQLYLANNTDEFREYLAFMNTLYEEGLMDVECFVMTAAEANAKCAADIYGFYGTASAPFAMQGTLSADDYYDWTAVPAFTINEGDTAVTVAASSATSTAGVMINVDTEYPEALCIFLDYFFNDVDQYLGIKGVEGVTFEFLEIPGLDDAYTTYYPDWEESGASSSENYKQQFGLIQGAFWLRDSTYGKSRQALIDADQDTFDAFVSDYDLITNYSSGWELLCIEYAREGNYETVDKVGNSVYLADEVDAINNIKIDLASYLETTIAQFITGELDVETDWDTYLKNLENMKVDELLELEQIAYDRTFG